MTLVPERPDYSSVPSMAFSSSDLSEISNLLSHLKSILVPVSIYVNYCTVRAIKWSLDSVGGWKVYGTDDKNILLKPVNVDEFKAPFEKIYKKWKEAKVKEKQFYITKEGNPTYGIPDLKGEYVFPDVSKPPLLVPTNKEIKEYFTEMNYDNNDISKNIAVCAIDWYKKKIIELNK